VRILRRISRTLTTTAVVLTAVLVVVSTTLGATVTSANDYPSTLETSQASNHNVLFTTPTGVSEGSTITITFASSFDTSSMTEDDIDITDDGVDLTTASDCLGSEQASVSIASDTVTIAICAGDGGAITATSVIGVEIGTNATSSGTGVNQVTNPASAGAYFVSIRGTFGDSGSIILPIGGDDSIGVTATVPSSGGGGGGGETDPIPADVDSTAPVISSIVVSSITVSSADISWTTDEAGVSTVEYWPTGSTTTSTVARSGYYTSHAISLSGLSEGTEYSFTVTSVDSSGNSSTSSTQTFTTLDETDPVISDIDVVDVTSTSARVTWTTNESADSTVSYGLSDSYDLSESDGTFEISHSVLLSDLSPGTLYHFQVLSTDASLNQAFSSDQTFTTDSDDAPGNVSSLSIEEGDGQLILSWVNPTDGDLVGTRILQCLGGYPTGPTDTACSIVSTSLGTSLTQTGLTNGTTYYYGVFAYDEAGQFASGALVLGTPQASEEEVPSDGTDGEDRDGSTDPETETGTPTEDPEEETDDTPPSDSAVSCGDDVCSETESSESCPEDCGETDEPTSLGAEEGDLSDADLIYLVADESITLETTRSGVVEVLPTSTLRIAIPESAISDGVRTIVLTVGSDTYLMRLDDALALFLADLTIPNVQTILQVSVLVTYESGVTDSVSSYLHVVTPGYVYQVIDGEEADVSTATVTLFENVGGKLTVWDGSPWSQFNPTAVASDASFGWYVPNGTYQVSASAEGFDSAVSAELAVRNSIVNPRILLALIKEEDEGVIVEEPSTETPPGEVAEEPTDVASTLLETLFDALPTDVARQTLETIRGLPGVEKTAEISTPVLAISAGVSVIVLSVAFDFLPLLQYFFTAPVLFFWRRRRKGYGIVYNAISKAPVDLAVVRLFQVRPEDEATGAHGRLVKSRVTDKGGRYFFLVPPGTYRIQVTKPGFQFPSDYLKEEKTDGPYLDVYHGETVEVTSEGVVVTANIPVDPSQAEKYQAPKAIQQRAFLRKLQHGVALTGVIASIVFAIIRPNGFSILMVAVQVAMYFVARRLVKPQRPISWGIVYDKDTARPLSRVVARIFEPKYNKLLETQVTDSKGRYAFILGPNQYYATFQKEGFKQTQIDPIDYSAEEEPKGFTDEVTLEAEARSINGET